MAATLAVRSVHQTSERQLLEQKAAEIGAVLTTAIAGVQTPIAAAAEVSSMTGGDAAAFTAAMQISLARNQFVGALLLDREGRVLVSTGGDLVLPSEPSRLSDAVDQALATDGLAIIDTLDLEPRVLGYAQRDQQRGDFVVYVESRLPARTGAPRPTGAFEDLHFSMFLGAERSPAALLYTSEQSIPLRGRVAVTTVPFGDTSLTVAVSTDEDLGGSFFGRLPWVILGGGLVLAVLVGILIHRVARGRRRAEELASDLAAAHAGQQHIIDTLQQSLLPRSVPTTRGAEVAAAYWPADQHLDVGGDFYDVVALGGGSWCVAIGDVCGKGVEAAALTAAVRHTIRAAAQQLTHPSDVLSWARDAVVAFDDRTYCTACFAMVRPLPHGLRVDLSIGGHPRPIHVTSAGAQPVGETGTLLGLVPPRFSGSSHQLDPDDLLVFYTDGITDAPGGNGLTDDELCALLSTCHGVEPEEALGVLHEQLERRRTDGRRDDVAVIVIRCTAPAVPS